MEIKKQTNNSVFDKEYDYIISLGHRCCVALANGYMRKSSFPFDWQITKIDLLPKIFKNEFKNFYPDSGVDFVHVYHKEDENGKSLGIDTELTSKTFERRSQRLIDLIKRNDRKLLFVRSKYIWYWYKNNHANQIDQNSTDYDIEILSQVSDIIKYQYKNKNSDFLYIYSALSDDDGFSRDPSCKKENLSWRDDGTIDPEDLVIPNQAEQSFLAKNFEYKELPQVKDIHKVVVQPNGVRVEAMSYNGVIFDNLKISDIKDF
jgi:hypothetical protein